MTDERLHQLSTMRGKEQEPANEVPAGDIAAVAKLADTTTGDVLGDARRRRSRSTPLEPPEPTLAGRDQGASRRPTRTSSPTRCTASQDEDPTIRVERNTRDAPDAAVGHGRDPPRHRARAAAAGSSASRSTTEDVQGRLPRDDHRRPPRPRASTRSRPAATASSASRSCASSRSSAAPASSSSTRSSAARSPASSSPRSRRASLETMEHGRRVRLPRRRREGHLLRRQVPLGRLVGDELQDGRARSGSRRRWRRRRRSCSSRSASSS